MNQIMTFHPFGDSALLIDFEQKIDFQVNQKVIGLTQLIKNSKWQEVTFMTPAYCSLTLGYNSQLISYSGLVEKIERIYTKLSDTDENHKRSKSVRNFKIPVCYDGEFAIDMIEITKVKGIAKEEIIQEHTSTQYSVFMLGFLPGFPYMGTLSDVLICDRKETPRQKVPAGSVGLAGSQTGIYPLEAPGGWQIIGRTPIRIFDGRKDNPFLFQAGDSVKFEAISQSVYNEIDAKNKSGSFNLNALYV